MQPTLPRRAPREHVPPLGMARFPRTCVIEAPDPGPGVQTRETHDASAIQGGGRAVVERPCRGWSGRAAVGRPGHPDATKRRRRRRFGTGNGDSYPIIAERSSGAGSGATVSGATGGTTSSR